MHMGESNRDIATRAITSRNRPGKGIKLRKATPSAVPIESVQNAKQEIVKNVVLKTANKNNVKAVAEAAQVIVDKATPIVSAFRAPYLYPVEMIDSPGYWDREESYFGDTGLMVPSRNLGDPNDNPNDYSWNVQSVSSAPAAAATQPTGFFDSLVSGFKSLVPVYLNYKQSEKLNQMNLDRARSGQPPISAASYAAMSAPAANVSVGLSPQTQNILIYGGLAAAGLLVMNMIMGKRRRG